MFLLVSVFSHQFRSGRLDQMIQLNAQHRKEEEKE